MKFILIALITNSYLGEYDSLKACEAALRTQYTARLYPGSLDNPAVQGAIDTALKYQRDYVCLPTNVPSN